MRKISIREAKAYLSRLFEQVGSGRLSLKEAKSQISLLAEYIDDGNEILITRDGEPVAKLVPLID